jgi:acetyl-CoA carboxylase carboxyltransferase component
MGGSPAAIAIHGDESIIVRDQSTIFLGRPPLVEDAATGEEVS